jgi:hypothetical protein
MLALYSGAKKRRVVVLLVIVRLRLEVAHKCRLIQFNMPLSIMKA